MKRTVLILLLISACSLLLAQTWQRSYPWQDVCQEEYNNASADVYNVIPAIGGGYLMQGYAVFAYNSPNIDILIMMTDIFWKIAENGDVVWRRTTYEWGEPYNAIASNGVDRYYALYGNDGNSLFVVYDEELNVVTSLSFPSQYGINNPLEDMVVVDDGIVFAGRRSAANGWFLMKIDFDYNLVWSKEIVNDIPDYGCESIKKTHDDGFIGISTRIFAQFNSECDTLWTYYNNGLQYFSDCIQTTDGNFYISGRDQTSNYKIYFVDSIADSISAINTGLPWSGHDKQPLSMSSNGNFVILNNTPQGILHEYSQQGGHIWSREYDGILGLGSDKMFCSETGYIIFCLNDNGNIVLVKADSSGNVVANDDPIAPKPEVYLSHYPNPVHGIVDIRYDIPYQRGQLRLEIVNIKGQRVLTKELNSKSGEYRWNGKDCNSITVKSGVYFYSIKDGNQTLKANKMVVIR